MGSDGDFWTLCSAEVSSGRFDGDPVADTTVVFEAEWVDLLGLFDLEAFEDAFEEELPFPELHVFLSRLRPLSFA